MYAWKTKGLEVCNSYLRVFVTQDADYHQYHHIRIFCNQNKPQSPFFGVSMYIGYMNLHYTIRFTCLFFVGEFPCIHSFQSFLVRCLSPSVAVRFFFPIIVCKALTPVPGQRVAKVLEAFKAHVVVGNYPLEN